MGLFRMLFGARKWGAALDADPAQPRFADALITAADGDLLSEFALKLFIDSYGWHQDEKEIRLAHALRIVEQMRPDLHAEAREVGLKQIA